MIFNPQSDTGLLEGARQCPSPNCDPRPQGSVIDLLVIHSISLPPGEFGGPWIDALFSNRLDARIHPFFEQIAQLRVSAHLLVRRCGEVVQYVPFHMRAWHAGESCYQGRRRCNDFSIGIELEGLEDGTFEKRQYTRLAKLATRLMHTYPGITPNRITGHSDIAPGRKTDPGRGFDWAYLGALMRKEERLI